MAWHAAELLRGAWCGSTAPTCNTATTAHEQPQTTDDGADVLTHALPQRAAAVLPQQGKAPIKIAGQVVRFEYLDAKGDMTQRRTKVDTLGVWQFEGYCYTRRARRTFRYDSVIGPVTLESTGELVDAQNLAAVLLQ